jgi:hypothetical protein
MKIYYPLILAVALAGLTSSAAAGTFNYTFVSVEYEKFSSKIDGFSDTLEGSAVSFDLSFAVKPNAAIIAEYSTGNADVTVAGTTVDAVIKSGTFGLIIHAPIYDATDILIGVAFINGKADVDVNGTFFGNVDADGGVTTIGIRTKISDKLELNGFLRRYSTEDASTINASFGAAYYVVESVSIDLGYSIDSDSDSLALGVTKYF